MIEVAAPGLLSSVRSLGRHGLARWGISAGGAADPLALRVGNRLVGNADDAAGIEMTLRGATLRFASDATAALTGADLGSTLDGRGLPLWRTFEVKANQVLHCGMTRDGARGYIAVRGGLEGGELSKGGTVRIGAATQGEPRVGVRRSWLERFAGRRRLRVTPGPEAEEFSAAALQIFYSATYTVREESNRDGLRLDGPAIDPPLAAA